ncbi:methylthioribulose 1-phosphate dehydratase [Altericista sp. CCNU0014]|uniref:methylthioribulose 1-phosphate dehydratase n=1 Tax=Altericista sp. CCNU0014 TaxID=3082949 RepID=UPI0038507170
MSAIAQHDPRPLLVAHARSFYERGWMWGTAGNLSARLPDNSFWITASGCAKGELTPEQFVQMSLEGKLLTQTAAKPSAETSIHQAVYRLFPDATACYHVHTVSANLASRLTAAEQIRLPAIEMLKGLGIWEANPTVHLALFSNHLQVSEIGAEMLARFGQKPPQIPACLIRDHGVTVWGRSQDEAKNRIEAMEFIFQYTVAAKSIDLPLI